MTALGFGPSDTHFGDLTERKSTSLELASRSRPDHSDRLLMTKNVEEAEWSETIRQPKTLSIDIYSYIGIYKQRGPSFHQETIQHANYL